MHITVTRPPTSQPPLATIGNMAIAGQVLLLASALLLPLVSEFSPVSDNISELVLGRFGFIQTIAFLIAGVTTLGLAYAIRHLTRGTWGSVVGPVLVGVYGLGAIVAAIFPTDRIDTPADVWSSSTTGLIHIGTSLISFVAMVVAMFILSRTFLLDPRWRSLFPWVVLQPGAALALMFVQQEGPRVGLMQRLMVGVIAAWIIAVGFRVRAIAATGQEAAT